MKDQIHSLQLAIHYLGKELKELRRKHEELNDFVKENFMPDEL